MISLVTFDLYQTLVYARPSRDERLADVCRELGLEADQQLFLRANVAAEELYTVENGRSPLHLRSSDEQALVYREMFAILLRGAGLDDSPELVERIRLAMEARRSGAEWVLFDDVGPTLAALRARGLGVGIVSNTPVDATILCQRVGLCDRVDFIVSSCLVGCEKPCPEIFRAALEQGRAPPEQALHVGDQPRSDALGAHAVGMNALLLDRHDLLAHEGYERIAGLAEVVAWVDRRRQPTAG